MNGFRNDYRRFSAETQTAVWAAFQCGGKGMATSRAGCLADISVIDTLGMAGVVMLQGSGPLIFGIDYLHGILGILSSNQ